MVTIMHEVFDSAFAWTCERRKDWLVMADVWTFRRRCAREKTLVCLELLEATYRVSLLSRVTLGLTCGRLETPWS